MKHCVHCRDEIRDEANVCASCGFDQAVASDGGYDERRANGKYCFECGELINERAEICPECGVRQTSQGSDSSSSEKVAAGVLALLLGGLGAHKFYQGNMKLGVLYLCFFWTAIPALLGLIEGILMLVADDDEYERKYADGSILGK